MATMISLSVGRTSVFILIVLCLPFAVPALGQTAFNEVSIAAGVGSDPYDSASRHGLGVNWIDYDNDTWPDLFSVNGQNAAGIDPHLFRNEQNGTFSNQDALLPVLPQVELTGSYFADYDNDGDQDIYITVAGGDLFVPDGPANMLLQNQWVENGNQVIAGQPLFVDVAAAAGVDNLAPVPFGTNPGYKSYTGGWLDYDRDSCIDLYVGTMVWDLGGSAENLNTLYRNNCDGTFTDVTASSNLNDGSDPDVYRPTLAFFGGLMDGDMWPDLYVINVHDFAPHYHDLYYRNNGDGTFSELLSTMPGLGDDSGAGMGIDLADIDLDGDWDIYMSDLCEPFNEPVMECNVFYTGNADGTWNENSAPAAGIASGDSWAVSFFDANMDGYEDLLVGVIAPNNIQEMLFENNGDGTFTDISVSAGMISGESRGSAVADYDRDGDLDFAIVNLNGSLFLYENVSTNTGGWLEIDLDATISNRSAIGTLIEVTADGKQMMRQVKGGVSAHSQDDLLVHFGLGNAAIVDEIRITWPSGIVQTLTDVAVDQLITVTETSSSLFTDVSSISGVDVVHDGAVVADMGIGTGAAWFDYDNDGDQDFYVTMRAGANKLFQNNGGVFTDVAAAAGAEDALHDGSGVAVADYNNDGCKDLYLANSIEDAFLQNNCDGTFTDVIAGSGLEASEGRRGTSASWGDYDQDGFVDLYVSHHVPFDATNITGDTDQDYLFHNNGDGTFTDVSDMTLGLDRGGAAFISGWTDYDNDGDLDLYTIRDCPFNADSGPMPLLRNDGGTNGVSDWTFTNVASAVGADWCQNGMGLAVGDFNRDSFMDYFFTDNGTVPDEGGLERQGPVLLRNDAGLTFTEITDAAGVANTYFSWGGNFFDYDLDGWLDLFMVGGSLNNLEAAVPTQLYHNDSNGISFTNVSDGSGAVDSSRTRTSVYSDFDQDGDPDLLLINYGGAVRLLRNDQSNLNNWVVIDLEGTQSNRDGIGSRLVLTTPDGVTQYYETRSGSSLGGGDDLGAYFGLGANASITSLEVTWPSGTVQTVTGLAINSRQTIVETMTSTSTLSVSPTAIDFGMQAYDTGSAPVSLVLSNSGPDAIDVTDVSLSGTDATDFGHDFAGPVTVAAGGQETVDVTFTPSAPINPVVGSTVLYRVNAGGALIAGSPDWEQDDNAAPSPYVNASATLVETHSSPVTLDASVPAGTPLALFETLRRDATKALPLMEWSFPTTAGEELEVHMYFAERSRCVLGNRLFDVEIEGTLVLDDFDIFGEVGCDVGVRKTFVVTPQDDVLNVNFPLGSNQRPSIVSAIEVVSVGSGADMRTADISVVHTGSNPSLLVPLTGEGISAAGGPIAGFTYVVTDLSVAFTDTSTDDVGVTTWSWDFGDGNVSSEQHPTHVYAAGGTYTVSLTVTDGDGLDDTVAQNVTVAGGALLFSDVSAAAGISVIHDGASIADMGLGTGAAWFDYDNDGDQDLYMTMRAGANLLFQNSGGIFTDVAAAAGVQDASNDGSGVAVADYNNDGCPDLYLANSMEDVLLQNNCDGTFTDVTAGSGVEASGQRRGTSASWGDYDLDGLLDLYVANHDPMEGTTVPDDKTRAQDYLYHNNGDGTFTDVSATLLGADREGMSFIASFTDYDQDGDSDIYLVKDCPFGGTGPLVLWRNDGGTDGVTDWSFTNVASSVGADWCQNGMGIAVGDYGRDGYMDYFFTDNGSVPSSGGLERAGAVLLKNEGGTTFTDATDVAGLANTHFSWGANFFDYDLDGWLDLFMAAGSLNDVSVKEPTQLWHNDGNGTSFTNVSAGSGVVDSTRSRTSVVSDYDADGDPDLFLVNYGGTARLLRNDQSSSSSWVIVELEGTVSNRDGIGSRLALTTPDGVTQYFETRSGSSLGGGDDLAAYFGLGVNASISSLVITWPSGTIQTINDLAINTRHTVVEASTLSVLPTSVDFGTQEYATSSVPVSLSLNNMGPDPIDVTSVTFSGPDAADFSHNVTGPITIPGGGSSSVDVTFTPIAPSDPGAGGTVLYRVNVGGSLLSGTPDWEQDDNAVPSPFVNASATVIETHNDPVTLDASVPPGTPIELFQTLRRDAVKQLPLMEWSFPVTAGNELEIHLYFAEQSRCVLGNRIFDVEIEGTLVLDEFDIFAEVGCDVGMDTSFVVTPLDDTLNINFPLGSNQRPPLVSGIEIVAGTSADLRSAEVLIVHTGSNPSLVVPLAGEGIVGAPSAKASSTDEDMAAAAQAEIPVEYALDGNYPNPFNPSTTVVFSLPEAADVKLHIFDMLGRRVANLFDSRAEAGRFTVVWDGRGDGGAVMASGVYILKMQAGAFVDTRTMILLK